VSLANQKCLGWGSSFGVRISARIKGSTVLFVFSCTPELTRLPVRFSPPVPLNPVKAV